MAARLTTQQKKQILAAHAEGQAITALAQQHGVCRETVRRLVKSGGRAAPAPAPSPEEMVQKLAAYLLAERMNPETSREALDAMPLKELAQVFGTVADKVLKLAQEARREPPAPPDGEESAVVFLEGEAEMQAYLARQRGDDGS